ncbi:MAG: hypothetical protein KC468_11400 [Myxococcales bacterium]|nr:hypothetical protein [Myxococcales bacterium]
MHTLIYSPLTHTWAFVATLALVSACSTKALDQASASDSEASTGSASTSGAETAGTTGGGSDATSYDSNSGATTSNTTATTTTASGATESSGTDSTTGSSTGPNTGSSSTTATGSSGTTETGTSGSTSDTGEPECVGLDEESCAETLGCAPFSGWPVLEMNGGLCTGKLEFVECGPDPGGCDAVISYGCDENEAMYAFPDACLPPSLEPCDLNMFPEPC